MIGESLTSTMRRSDESEFRKCPSDVVAASKAKP